MQDIGQDGIHSAKKVAEDLGVSSTTVWRHGRKGDLDILNIAGRPYGTKASLAEFVRRAKAGEIAKKRAEQPENCTGHGSGV